MTRTPRDGFPLIVTKADDDQICNICLEPSMLTDDHVPPQGCLRDRRVRLYGLMPFLGEARPRAVVSQSGLRFKTLCAKCNNSRVGLVDVALKDLFDRVSSFVESKLELPRRSPYLTVRCRPRAVLQALIGHLLSAKRSTDRVGTAEVALRPCILDPTRPIPDAYHFFYWLHPHAVTRVTRDFAMPRVRGRYSQGVAFCSVLKFYPLGFLMTDAPSYEGLFSLDEYRAAPVDFEAEVKLVVDHVYEASWPDNVKGDNFLLGGEALRDAAIALPHRKK